MYFQINYWWFYRFSPSWGKKHINFQEHIFSKQVVQTPRVGGNDGGVGVGFFVDYDEELVKQSQYYQ